MFDLAWSEILLIGAVALIAIGPKDMPVAIRTVTSAIKKARRMAAEFQSHVDEMVREADLGDVKKSISELRNFDLKGHVERAVDPDHSIRDSLADNPLSPAHPTPSEVSTLDEVAVAANPELESVPLAEVTLPSAAPEKPASPAFVPPNLVPRVLEAAAPPPDAAPAFIPPNIARH
jgi:sec-independent protein translocase protein TatB